MKKISSSETTIFVYDGGSQLVAEYTAWTGGDPAPAPQVSYLTQDHLGSPRVVTNQNGEVIKRTDWMAFGEEVEFNKRTSGLGYDEVPETRKGYTGYEKDEESGLDFAQARYYNPKHGRYTSVDPLTASANIKNPQTFNRYTYVLNSPYKYVDPLGLISSDTGARGGAWCSTCETGDGPGGFREPDSAGPASGPTQDSTTNDATGLHGTTPNASTAQPSAAPPLPPPPPGFGDSLTEIRGFINDGRDGSTDGAPVEFGFMDSVVVDRFKAAVLKIEEGIGKKVLFTEMFRPEFWQKRLREKYIEGGSKGLPADEPGTSTHEAGLSFDVKLSEYTYAEQEAIFKYFADAGFERNVAGDPVHFTWWSIAPMRTDSGPSPELKKIIENNQANYWKTRK